LFSRGLRAPNVLSDAFAQPYSDYRSGTVNDLPRKVAFLEARLTLLERRLSEVEARLPSTVILQDDVVPDPIHIACTEPGLMIYRNYPVETDPQGRQFCWVGNDGPIQLVLPVRPSRPITCRLHFQAHPVVDFSKAAINVNDCQAAEMRATQNGNLFELCFDVPPSAAPNLNIMLLGVASVTPADIGQNTDIRKLAAKFFGADILFS
jgi:hypothetical protein